jgi:hypothetical protein
MARRLLLVSRQIKSSRALRSGAVRIPRKVGDMQTSYSAAEANRPDDRAGTVLSVAGLLAWLSAMMLAIAGPLLGLQVPPLLIVGMVVFSGAFSVLSLPKLIGLGKRQDDHHGGHA